MTRKEVIKAFCSIAHVVANALGSIDAKCFCNEDMLAVDPDITYQFDPRIFKYIESAIKEKKAREERSSHLFVGPLVNEHGAINPDILTDLNTVVSTWLDGELEPFLAYVKRRDDEKSRRIVEAVVIELLLGKFAESRLARAVERRKKETK